MSIDNLNCSSGKETIPGRRSGQALTLKRSHNQLAGFSSVVWTTSMPPLQKPPSQYIR